MSYKIWLTNFRYFASSHMKPELNTLEEAVARAKETGFECNIMRCAGNGVMVSVASWSPIGGTRIYDENNSN